MEGIFCVSLNPLKVKVCQDFFQKKIIAIDYGNNSIQQPRGWEQAKECALNRIHLFNPDPESFVVSLENYLEDNKDFCLVVIWHEGKYYFGKSFGILVDPWVLDELKTFSLGNSGIDTIGKVYATKLSSIDPSNWMKDIRGIDRVDQMTFGLRKAYYQFLQFPELIEYEDFPKKGVMFYDIFPFVKESIHREGLKVLIRSYYRHISKTNLVIIGVESKGFFLGPIVADALDCIFVPVRKKGKLPGGVVNIDYQTEYSFDAIEILPSHFPQGKNLRGIIVDDLLATGGTVFATQNLLRKVFPSVRFIDCFFLFQVNCGEKKPIGLYTNFVKHLS